MQNNYSHLPLASLMPQFQTWSNLINHKQIAHLFFLPHTGMLYRLYQFRDHYDSKHTQHLNIVDMDTSLIADGLSLSSRLSEMSDRPTILVARRAFLGPDKQDLSQALQSLSLTHQSGLLVIHESAPIELKMQSNLPSVMYHQLIPFSPISDQSSMSLYLKNLAKDWDIKLLKEDPQIFIDYCHNQTWLLNELLRLRLANPNLPASQLLTSSSIHIKENLIWDQLPQIYQDYYLGTLKSNIILSDLEAEITAFKLPLFTQIQSHPYFANTLDQVKKSLFTISSSRIIYRSADLTKYFSQSERTVLAIISCSPTPTNKEAISEAYWPINSAEKYSDWAIDQLMSRLRKKITKYELPISIKTFRGNGYALTR